MSTTQMNSGARKRHRYVGGSTTSGVSSTAALLIDSAYPDRTRSDSAHKIRRTPSATAFTATSTPLPPPVSGGFNDHSTADVILRLYFDNSPFDPADSDSVSAGLEVQSSEVQIHVHSSALLRARYFDALLSDRWKNEGSGRSRGPLKLNFGVSPTIGSMHTHVSAIRLLYSDDFSDSITSPSDAISMLPVALKLLFEDCIKHCVRFLEAVPWTEDEEQRVLSLIPLLGQDEAEQLLARVSPDTSDSSEEMLHGLIVTAIHNHPNVAAVKTFVSRLLRDFSSRDAAKKVLEKAFWKSLSVVKQALEEYSSPEFRSNHNETEAIQRLNLHAALTNGKQLVWLVERMIELRVAEMAVKEWSQQSALAVDLQRAFRDDAWRNIVPGLPNVVLRCTSKLAYAVISGTVLVDALVRRKLVEDWLPVLIVCKDNLLQNHKPVIPNCKSLCLELEEAFLRIISTLPMADAQELLHRCLSFSTRDSGDCPHLVEAFNIWFRRAARPPQARSSSV